MRVTGIKVVVESAEGFPGYVLYPVARELERRFPMGILFQVDYDYPCLASNLGWRLSSGRRSLDRKCQHQSTDGTVDCPDCGATATDFISTAAEWLERHSGTVIIRPVEYYFTD